MSRQMFLGWWLSVFACVAFAPAGALAQSAKQVNPHAGNADAIAQGEHLFVTKSCSGCHGAGGGGGMGPPVINDIWIYGNDDATLFQLIKLGSVGFRAQGQKRVGREAVVGDMPAMGGVASDEEIWKLIAFMRSKSSAGR